MTDGEPEGVRQQEHALLLGHHAVASPGRGIDTREAQWLIKWRVSERQIRQHCAVHMELAVRFFMPGKNRCVAEVLMVQIKCL